MKSQVSALLHVLAGIIKDAKLAYPALKGFDSDYGRLSLYCQTRGLAFFTLDLPNLDALLLQGLETGRLVLNGPLSRRISKRIRVPRLFSGLWLRVFDRDACLKQDGDETAIFFLRQLCCLGKKLQVECTPDRIATTLENFHATDRRLRPPSFDWDADSLVVGEKLSIITIADSAFADVSWSPLYTSIGGEIPQSEDTTRFIETYQDRRVLNRIQKVADLILGSFEPFNPIKFSNELDINGQGIGFKHGPGAVAERLRNDEKSLFPNWPAKLQHTFPYELVGKTSGSDINRPMNHEVPSRLICVPKTAKGPRLIAAEPTAHQYCQQMVRLFMEKQLSRLFGTDFIDFRDQRKSGMLVLDASQKGSLATVDLSDASDRLSCWTVERIFRANYSLLLALHAARTRYLRDDVSKVKGFLKLRKFASQGTATTFPVQSIVFLCIALGCSIKGDVTMDNIRRLRNQVRVFGDDIIIPKHGYAPLLRAMTHLQLKVNQAKSYVNGKFRESCGTDGYNGYDVTPVKPKTLVADSPASCQAVVDTSNNLLLKGLFNASHSCRALLPPRVQRGLRIVARNDAGFSGLLSYSGSDESHLKTRWNSRLHRYEVRVWSVYDRTPKRDRGGYGPLLDFFTSKHNSEHARIVSKYGHTRKARDRFSWEPLNSGARTSIRGPS